MSMLYSKYGMSVKEHILFSGRRNTPVEWAFAKLSNNLAAWAVMHVLERRV